MHFVRWLVAALIAGLTLSAPAYAQVGGDCPRPGPGVEAKPAADLYSKNGVLNVKLNYFTGVEGPITLFCFVTARGDEAPTLHVNPGDTIKISLTNMVPGNPASAGVTIPGACAGETMTSTSTNMHFHGTNTSPKCHGDEVIHTVVNSGQTFDYVLKIPKDEPPGLYWYHTHVHGIASPTVQGGASGMIEVEGISNLEPVVSGLPERFLDVRDQGLLNPDATAPVQIPKPFWDVSLNYVPVSWPQYTPAIIKMNPGMQEFWRVANTSADTILNLRLVYDGQSQPLKLVALDGVPIGSQDGKRQGTTLTQDHIYIPPASRAEFVVTAPSASVKKAMLWTMHIDTGPAGDFDPTRPLAIIKTTNAPLGLPLTEVRSGPPNPQRFEDLADARVTKRRKLYFSEQIPPGQKDGDVFYITVDGQGPEPFDPAAPPAITTRQGAVEDWTIENHAKEVHEFHIHQIHFLLLEVNGKPVPKSAQQFYDTYQVGYWTGSGPYPSIKVRMDFRGNVVGDFVYHCHILDHEDLGMMAKIRVKPRL